MLTGRIVKSPSVGTARYTVVVPSVPVDDYGAGLPHERRIDVPSFFDDENVESEGKPLAVDLNSIEQDARALVEAAESDAHSILVDARDRAAKIVESATTTAKEFEEKGREDGYAAGRDDGRAAGEGEFTESLGVLRKMIESARDSRRRFVESAEGEVVRLAMAIAERVLHQQVAIDKSVVVEMTKAALSRLVERESITVRVNPLDLDTMRDHRDEVLALGEVKQMRVIPDQRVDRGGVIIETEAGAVDAKMSTQIREARRVLNIEDEVTVAPPAPEDTEPS